MGHDWGAGHVYGVLAERPDLVRRHLEKMKSMLAEIITEGDRAGEFDAPDASAAAGAVLSACTKFIAPHFIGMFPLEVLREEASEVIQVLVRGLRK